MRLETGLRAMVAVCILFHGSHALIIGNTDNKAEDVDICATRTPESTGAFKNKFGQLPGPPGQTCTSDLCHEENTDNYNLHMELKKSNQHLIEGDILCQDTKILPGQRVVTKKTKLWKPKIKYKIEDTFDNQQKKAIRGALKDVETRVQQDTDSCAFSLTEEEHITDDQHILFKKGSGYFTAVGKQATQKKPHNITVSTVRNINAGSVKHELMHALGFWHEHARPDRDRYITINYKNILPKQETNFIKLSDNQVKPTYTKIGYDPCSILHYGPKAFSFSKDKDTIVLNSKYYKTCMGQRVKLTDSDVERIQNMFDCSKNRR